MKKSWFEGHKYRSGSCTQPRDCSIFRCLSLTRAEPFTTVLRERLTDPHFARRRTDQCLFNELFWITKKRRKSSTRNIEKWSLGPAAFVTLVPCHIDPTYFWRILVQCETRNVSFLSKISLHSFILRSFYHSKNFFLQFVRLFRFYIQPPRAIYQNRDMVLSDQALDVRKCGTTMHLASNIHGFRIFAVGRRHCKTNSSTGYWQRCSKSTKWHQSSNKENSVHHFMRDTQFWAPQTSTGTYRKLIAEWNNRWIKALSTLTVS